MARVKRRSRYGVGVPVPERVRREVLVALRGGEDRRVVVSRFDVSVRSVQRWVAHSGGMPARWRDRSPLRLSFVDRTHIEVGVARGESFREIAARLGRSPSTVSREVNAHGGRDGYWAAVADRAAYESARRPKPTVFEQRPRLAGYVNDKLALKWSPQQICDRLKVEFPDDEEMRVSAETIYQALFVQSKGGLRKQLVTELRSGRVQRRPHTRSTLARGRIKNMTMISQRPAEADDRAVPGHWEGDLIIGANGNSAIGTLVERSLRLCLLLHLPNGRTTNEVTAAMQHQIATLPTQLFRSITWDQGKELAAHTQFTIATGIPVYFCDPHAPWQRGTNENTNGLLRQYFPKGTDLSIHTQADLDHIAAELNNRPRRVLGSLTPSEAYTRFVALTT